MFCAPAQSRNRINPVTNKAVRSTRSQNTGTIRPTVIAQGSTCFDPTFRFKSASTSKTKFFAPLIPRTFHACNVKSNLLSIARPEHARFSRQVCHSLNRLHRFRQLDRDSAVIVFLPDSPMGHRASMSLSNINRTLRVTGNVIVGLRFEQIPPQPYNKKLVTLTSLWSLRCSFAPGTTACDGLNKNAAVLVPFHFTISGRPRSPTLASRPRN